MCIKNFDFYPVLVARLCQVAHKLKARIEEKLCEILNILEVSLNCPGFRCAGSEGQSVISVPGRDSRGTQPKI